MSFRVIIQKDQGEFLNANGFTAWQGFEERGREIQFSTWEQMAQGLVPVDRDTITVGSVVFVRAALRKLDAEPTPLGYPPELEQYLGRKVWRTTLSEIRSRVDVPGVSIFVKPRELDKAFTGHVVSAFRDLIRTARWPGTMPIWASEPVQFASEYRVFVQESRVIGLGHYKGDPLLFPNPHIIRTAIADYAESAPAAYAIDFGVVENGETRLVEVNEGFSLGCLGLGPLAYSEFLEVRWRQLVATSA